MYWLHFSRAWSRLALRRRNIWENLKGCEGMSSAFLGEKHFGHRTSHCKDLNA